MTDYSATPHAHRTRLAKAKTIAATAWDLGLTPEDILHALTEDQWAALARHATSKPASEETRRLTYCDLSLHEAWAAGHPGEPRARRTVRPLADILTDLTRKAPRR